MPRALLLVLAIFLWLGQSMFGQFSGLATTDDGSQLYFSSSLQLIGSKNENPYSKIFRYDASGGSGVRDAFRRSEGGGSFHLAAQVDKVANGAMTGILTNFYNLSNPYVSGDGSVTGYVGTADCVGICLPVDASQTTLQSAVPATLPHACQVSRNAQCALCHISDGGVYGSAWIVSLITGAQSAGSDSKCFNQPHTITSDGRAVLVSSFGQVSLGTLSGHEMLNLQTAGCASISDDASRIVAPSNDGSSLIAYNVATGVEYEVLATPAGLSIGPISNDGNLILFLLYTGTIGQAAIVRADGTGFLPLTNDPTGVSAEELSGDGSTVFAVTNSGRLLKIDTTTGASSVLASAGEVQQVQGGAVDRLAQFDTGRRVGRCNHRSVDISADHIARGCAGNHRRKARTAADGIAVIHFIPASMGNAAGEGGDFGAAAFVAIHAGNPAIANSSLPTCRGV